MEAGSLDGLLALGVPRLEAGEASCFSSAAATELGRERCLLARARPSPPAPCPAHPPPSPLPLPEEVLLLVHPDRLAEWGSISGELEARLERYAQEHGPLLHLHFLGVRPEAQHRGLGRAVLTHLERMADAGESGGTAGDGPP